MLRSIKVVIFIALLGMNSILVLAQDCSEQCIEFYGYTFTSSDSSRLAYVTVIVTRNDSLIDSTTSLPNGKYEVKFNAIQKQYKIYFSKTGYFTKSLELNLLNADSSEFGKYNFLMETKITLIERNDTTELLWGLLEFLPIGKGSWNDEKQLFLWDFNYTGHIQSDAEIILDRIKKYLILKKSWMENPE